MQILKQAESGIWTLELCKEYDMRSATFYKWRGTPTAIRCELTFSRHLHTLQSSHNGPLHISATTTECAKKRGTSIDFI